MPAAVDGKHVVAVVCSSDDMVVQLGTSGNQRLQRHNPTKW